MKKNILATIILFALATFSGLQLAAQKIKNDDTVKGHWQLVSNIHQKKVVTVQFYTDDNTLMYQETLSNVRLNIERKKVQRKLNDALKESYQIWATTHAEPQAKDLIAKRIK